MNASTTMPAFLLLLALVKADAPMYGRQLAAITRVPEDTVYPTLRRLEARGLLTSEPEAHGTEPLGRKPRLFYSPTPAAALEVHRWEDAIEQVIAACTPSEDVVARCRAQVIWLRDHEGLDFTEIGRRVGVTRSRARLLYLDAVVPDWSQELTRCTMAARSGDGGAARRLAELYEIMDARHMAVQWWRRAADLGDRDAMDWVAEAAR